MKRSLLIALAFSLFFTTPLLAQSWKWARGSGCSKANESIETAPIIVDKSGNVYQPGYAIGSFPHTDTPVTFTFGPFSVIDSNDVFALGFLVSTDSNGNYRWVIGSHGGDCRLLDVAISPAGDLYVVGNSPFGHTTLGTVSFTGTDFCAKVKTDGTVQWIRSLVSGVEPWNIKTGNNGNIYVAGTFSSASLTIGTSTLTNHDPTHSTSDVFIAEFDSSGSPIWAHSFGGPGAEKYSGMALGPHDEIFVAGTWNSSTMTIGSTTLSTPGGEPFYLARFNSNGTASWARSIPATNYDYINGVAADISGNAYLTGRYAYTFSYGPNILSSPHSYGMFLLKTDSLGTPKWATTDSMPAIGYSVAADACGNIWTSGQVSVTTPGSDSSFMSEFDTAGHLLSTFKLSGGGDDVNGLAVDNKGNVYQGADYAVDTEIFGTDTLVRSIPGGGEYLSVAKYNYPFCNITTSSSQTGSVILQAGINLFPNPANETCTIQSSIAFPPGSTITVYDVAGRQVLTYPLTGTQVAMPLTGISAGLYSCKIYNGGVETRKLAIIR